MAADSGMKNIQALIPIVGSGGGRQCGRDHTNNLFRRKNLRMGDMEQDTHREREREREAQRGISINKYATVTTTTTTTITKGYKVNLYSDSLRATALYAIYTNGPNLGTQGGQCEYVHYTLVFDTPP